MSNEQPLILKGDRILAVPAFPGLQQFPDGCDFQQWTGDDSKALMKVLAMAVLRVSTSAPVGDPDPYPWVYRLSKLKLRSV
jgi:hypothetical protein